MSTTASRSNSKNYIRSVFHPSFEFESGVRDLKLSGRAVRKDLEAVSAVVDKNVRSVPLLIRINTSRCLLSI